jgi:hypothetical protein
MSCAGGSASSFTADEVAKGVRGRRAYADSPASAESVSRRENLPDELEPGVTYRDFAVRWRVAARLKDPD